MVTGVTPCRHEATSLTVEEERCLLGTMQWAPGPLLPPTTARESVPGRRPGSLGPPPLGDASPPSPKPARGRPTAHSNLVEKRRGPCTRPGSFPGVLETGLRAVRSKESLSLLVAEPNPVITKDVLRARSMM